MPKLAYISNEDFRGRTYRKIIVVGLVEEEYLVIILGQLFSLDLKASAKRF